MSISGYTMAEDIKSKIQIIVATHKQYQMPEDEIYLPLHVGAEGKKDKDGNDLDFGYLRDNTGDNISDLNASFCELTGLYWAWKNLDTDYIGVAHYRRHFGRKHRGKNCYDNVMRYEDLKPFLGKIKVFTPNKRKYYIETLYSHYGHTHYSSQLDQTRTIISEKYPEYIESYDKILNHRYGYMFNMMIMDREYLDNYCSWLFDVLFELKDRINMQEMSAFQGRFYGRVSEIIFNVWLDYQIESGKLNKNQIMEITCIHMEKIDWWKKGRAFLEAKFLGKRYEESF